MLDENRQEAELELRPEPELELESEIELSDKEIFTKIWTNPRMVFKYLNDYQYNKFVILLLVLGGIARGLDRAVFKNMGDNISLIGVLIISILVGGLLGWIAYYIFGWVLSWTGKWLKGEGDSSSLVRIMVHAMIPSLVGVLLFIPQIAMFGNGVFQSDFNIFSCGIVSVIIYFTTTLLELILGIWSFVLLVIGVSEVQKFSIGKAVLNLLLPILIFAVLTGIIALILSFVR